MWHMRSQIDQRNLGFSVKRRVARVGRNPRSATAVQVGEKCVPYFKTGKQLRKRLNESQEPKG